MEGAERSERKIYDCTGEGKGREKRNKNGQDKQQKAEK